MQNLKSPRWQGGFALPFEQAIWGPKEATASLDTMNIFQVLGGSTLDNEARLLSQRLPQGDYVSPSRLCDEGTSQSTIGEGEYVGLWVNPGTPEMSRRETGAALEIPQALAGKEEQ